NCSGRKIHQRHLTRLAASPIVPRARAAPSPRGSEATEGAGPSTATRYSKRRAKRGGGAFNGDGGLMKTALLALVLAAAVSSGCAHATHGASDANQRTFCAKSTATLYVQNDNWMDIVVYAVRGSSRFRMGQVSSLQSAVFELPSAVIGASGSVYILAD